LEYFNNFYGKHNSQIAITSGFWPKKACFAAFWVRETILEKFHFQFQNS